jgi:hypothetical protein
MDKPVPTQANDANVKSTLENLSKLEVTEQISNRKESWSKYGVSDDKAVHAVFYQGKDVVLDAYFGENGTRGQMTRFAGKDGVYAVSGYSAWLYKRETKDWRNRQIFDFDDAKAKTVEITNQNGKFLFTREGDKWHAKLQPTKGPNKDLERFDDAKLKDLLRAYKSLNADNFGDGKSLGETGLEKPESTLTITLEDGARRQVLVGSKAAGESRWAKQGDNPQIFSVASWSGDWATAAAEKFQKPDEKKKDKKDKDKPGDMPPGMPPGMDMPPMHHGHDMGE